MSAAGATPLPCKEIFDENSQPSIEEVNDYARQIGIDPSSESYLLPLAKDGLMQALPSPWKAYYDDKLKSHYYYNPETKVTQWDHPLDQVYKGLVVKARQASERGDSILDDTCMSIQDLPTYEEEPKDISIDKLDSKDRNGDSSIDNSLEEELSGTKNNTPSKSMPPKRIMNATPPQKPGVSPLIAKRNLSPFGALVRAGEVRIGGTKLTGESNTFPRTAQLSLSRFKQQDIFDDIFKSDDSSEAKPFDSKNITTAGLPGKVPTKQTSDIIDLSFNPKKNEDSADSESSKHAPVKGLTLTGGGSIFLKSNRVNQNATMTAGPQSNGDNPKSILRERNFGELNFKSPIFEKNDQKTNDDEDKKSVRFNLEDKNINFQYDYSPSPSSNSSSDAMLEGNQNSIIQGGVKTVPDVPHVGWSMARRNSDNSIMLGEIPNFVKNGKLKPLNYEENARLNQQINKDQSVIDGKQNGPTKTDEQSSVTNSPVRKLIKPSPSDFIKPNLFQKPFEKLSDILKTTSPDSESESDQQPAKSTSPPPPVKRKLSINLMESVDSEASIDSPDRERCNFNIPDGYPEKEARKGAIREIQRRHSIGKMLPVGENEIYDDVQTFKNTFQERRNFELGEMKRRMESELKQAKLKMDDEFRIKLESLREILKSEQARNEADIRKVTIEATLELKQNHDEEVAKAVDKVKLEFVAEKERAIENERKRLADDMKEAIGRMNEEHAKEIEKLRQEKKAQLVSISTHMEQENAKAVNELRLQYSDNLEAEKIRLIAENKSVLDKMKNDHELMCDELKKDYRSEIELVRGQQAAHLSALRDKLRREREPPKPPTALSPPSTGLSPRDDMSYERLRCDKRLLEDKYRCLKEKYARLKSDVKISIERRNKRREQSLTTGSETERSHSHKTLPSTDKSGDAGDSTSANKSGKRLVLVNNNATYPYIKSFNNNDPSKEPTAENNNSRGDNVDVVNSRYPEEQSPSQYQPCSIMNHLMMPSKSVRHLSPSDPLKVKCTMREKSPTGRVAKAERQKSFNGDNESSIGINDTSLSQSDSHPISNKFSKRVNIVENYKEKTKEFSDGKIKSAIRKITKRDHGYADSTVTDYHDSSDTGASERHLNESLTGRHRKKFFTRLKSASTSRLNYSISSKLNERACSPVENLRQQLRKLEDLEEQFPDVSLNADTTAYRLRYPFPDAGNGGGVSGGELGFLRHRALVEREGVRRARAVLRRRTDLLKQRRRSPAAWQEECELTDMEVSLHRTKAILGEKVIRLRHIEKCLRRLQNNQDPKDSATESNISKQREPENKDTTLSDISSHSSGFSSTEGHSDTNRNTKHNIHNSVDYEHSSEIINSLQTLNTEIKDIWQVLNAQQQMNVAKVIPIGQLLYTDVGWQLPIAASNIPNIQNLPNAVSINVPAINITPEGAPRDRLQAFRHAGSMNPKPAQALPPSGNVASSLVERTRDLRDWLKQQAAL